MSPVTFTERRKIIPKESKPCIVDDPINLVVAERVYNCTRYGSPFNFNEIKPQESLPPTLNGVVHLITRSCWENILATEVSVKYFNKMTELSNKGGFGHDIQTGYNIIDITVKTNEGEIIVAKTLQTRPASLNTRMQPTKRYMNLLITGAKHHGIDAEYIKYLESIPTYEIKTLSKKFARIVYIAGILPVLVPSGFVLLLGRSYLWLTKSKNKKLPKIAALCFQFATFWGMFWHDRIVSPLFGNGLHV
ncbi:hypothetical protein HK096_005696 [Nowakowskiella sp. JEL0078]|nr:hypothetical protein HK096_005696 [Nowakowskiella sp. JEL0078]